MPWVGKPADPAAEYAKGLQIGSQIWEAEQRLQAQQQQHAQDMALRQQQIDQNARIESQRIEITKAYHDAQIGVQKQRLEDYRKINDFKIQQTALQFAARQRMSQRIAAKEDPFRVMLEEGAAAGIGGPAMASAARAQQASLPLAPVQTSAVLDPTTKAPMPNWFATRTTAGTPEVHRATSGSSDHWERGKQIDVIKVELKAAQDRLKDRRVQMDIEDGKPEALALKEKADSLSAQLKDLVGMQVPAPQTRPVREIYRRVKGDKKVAVFDADTKQFLRYAE